MPQRHHLPESLLADLAAGGGGHRGVAVLTGIWRSRNLTLLAALVGRLGRRGGEPAAVARAATAVLADVAATRPAAFDRVFGYPAVSAWLSASVAAGGDGAAPGLAELAASAAVRAGHDADVPLGATRDAVVLPSLGVAAFPSPVDRVRVRDARLGLPPGGTWRGLGAVHAEEAGLTLHAAFDSAGGDPRTPGMRIVGSTPARLARWQDGITPAWRLLARVHGPAAAETAAATSVLVPLARDHPGMVSGTFRRAFGAIALSEPDDVRTTAMTLVHEAQHGKLAVIMEALPLLRPDDARYRVQWRPDPRPLPAVLQGTYAHLGVAAFWRRQRAAEPETSPARDHAEVEFARWRQAAHEGAEVLLGSGKLTEAGHFVVSRLHAALSELLAEEVPARAAARAAELRRLHSPT